MGWQVSFNFDSYGVSCGIIKNGKKLGLDRMIAVDGV